MRRFLLVIILLGILYFCAAEEIIDLNFYNELKADFNDFSVFREFQENAANDSIISYNIFSGRILKKYEGDIFPLAFLNYVYCDLASPTDYYFEVRNNNLNFEILASNITSDSIAILPFKIVETDSMKIGIFSIYTPDFVVKNEISSKVEFNFQVFAVTEAVAEFLASRTDLVIMISNLSRFIDKDIVKDKAIDIVVSSDYSKSNNSLLNNKTPFYSIISNRGKFGRLRLIYSAGEIKPYWYEEDIELQKIKNIQSEKME
jgi:hypothetical protein